MQRRRLTTVLASLGLGCTPTVEPIVEPGEPGEPGEPLDREDIEPSGLGATTTARTDPAPARREFEGVPTSFCGAELSVPRAPVLETESFLLAWNELAPTLPGHVARSIPTTELDARIALCGAESCTIADAQVVEATASYRVGVGILVASEAGMLVIPNLAEDKGAGPCASKTTATVERVGPFVHVEATTNERVYLYRSHHGYYEGHLDDYCEDAGTTRRDLIVDTETGTLALGLAQVHPTNSTLPWVELELADDSITLVGCGDRLELRWTGSGP